MSNKIKDICKEILGYGEMHRSSVIKTLEDYRKEISAIKVESEKYKAQNEYFTEKQQAAAAKARDTISRAEKQFKSNVSYSLDKYRDALKDTLVYKICPEFLDNLRLYNDFNVPMSRLECEMLINLSNGNIAALNAINSVLEKNDADFRISFAGIAEYDKQIHSLERLTVKANYIPMEYYTEGVEIYKDTSETYIRDDLSTYQTGVKMDGIAIMEDRATFEKVMKSVSDTISGLDDKKPQVSFVSVELKKKQAEAVKEAAQIGRTQAEADKAAREGLKKYL